MLHAGHVSAELQVPVLTLCAGPSASPQSPHLPSTLMHACTRCPFCVYTLGDNGAPLRELPGLESGPGQAAVSLTWTRLHALPQVTKTFCWCVSRAPKSTVAPPALPLRLFLPDAHWCPPLLASCLPACLIRRMAATSPIFSWWSEWAAITGRATTGAAAPSSPANSCHYRHHRRCSSPENSTRGASANPALPRRSATLLSTLRLVTAGSCRSPRLSA